MPQHEATCAVHVFRPHLGIGGDAQKIAGRLFAVLKVPIDSEIELRGGFGVKLDFSYASH